MNPTNYEQPNFSLPEPQSAVSGNEVSGNPLTPEHLPPIGSATPTMHSAQMSAPMVPIMPGASAVQSVATQPTPAPTTPSLADDADLIEKEWVMKAKAIVERTREEPHQQTAEMSRFKADYLKKRYNKDIKISES